MAFAVELDDLRQEVRVDYASTITFWPKVDGSGNVAASSTGGDNTVEFRDSGNNVILAAANIAPTSVGSVSRFDISVPAISSLGEDYMAKLLWKQNGGSFQYQETIYFDVVREPWGPSAVSLNTLQAYVPDIGDRITRQAERLSQTVDQRASVIGHLARKELSDWLRAAVTEDTARMGVILSTRQIDIPFDAYLRPRLIKDKARLQSIEVKIALAVTYAAELRTESGDDAMVSQEKRWLDAARTSFKGLGPLRYDLDDDLAVDTIAADVARFTPVRRIQS